MDPGSALRTVGVQERITHSLLVGAEAIWRQAEQDIRAARSRVYIQAMTFEADTAGKAVARAISESTARRRKVLVDDFSRYVVSDASVHSFRYVLDRSFRREVHETRAMYRTFRKVGVGVKITNPIRLGFHRFPYRNHKKLILADDVAYIGGLNFSDHNFAWGDLMLRIRDGAIAQRLAHDFDHTFIGRPSSWAENFSNLNLHGLDGSDNERCFEGLLAEIDRAHNTICIVSPYLTFPFLDALARAAARGVAVQLITPLANNKPIVRDYLLAAAWKAGFDVRLTPDMIHTKGILLDGRTLVLGSSNFDFVSYHVNAEFMAIVEDAELIGQFRAEVIAPYLLRAASCREHLPPAWKAVTSHAALRLAAVLLRAGKR